MQEYFSDRELAKRYDVSRLTIWRWVREGFFPPPDKLGPNTSRWRGPGVVEPWEAKRAAGEEQKARAKPKSAREGPRQERIEA